MSETDNESQQGTTDAERDLAPHERAHRDRPQNQTPEPPETGLISDEQLPEDVRPTDDNPLAKNPGDAADDDGTGTGGPKLGGTPDAGPGAPG